MAEDYPAKPVIIEEGSLDGTEPISGPGNTAAMAMAMDGDERATWSLALHVIDVLEQHGFRATDDHSRAKALALIGPLARAYEGRGNE